MNIKQLSPDKLRVLLDLSDLEKYDLDYFSISSESPGTKRLLKEILYEAQKNGFSTERCKILIEVLPGKNKGCILYLTKAPYASKQRAEHGGKNTSVSYYLLSCCCLDDAIEALCRFRDYPDIPMRSSSLFCYNGTYYLVFLPVLLGLDRDRLVSLIAALSEYGDTESANAVKIALLTEHGEVILKERAVESFIRYFK
jgi:adapter protein MecA 1/2